MDSIQLYNTKLSQYYTPEFVDYTDIQLLNHHINRAREALMIVTDKINEAESMRLKAKNERDKAWRRALIESNEKTQTLREVRADIATEDLDDLYQAYDNALKQLIRNSQVIIKELQTYQTIANNLRQQMKEL